MSFWKRTWQWIDDRSGAAALIRPIAELPVPRGSGWSDVFGSATLFAFLLQVVTGVALATGYVPSAEAAYESLQFITFSAPFGYLLRGMHFYGASAIMLMVGLHALQVFLSGSFKFPRELNWLTGVVLLLATIAMAFTGQLLRWDDNSVWSIFVFGSHAARVPIVGDQLARFILAGNTVGGATLSRFFAFHVFFVPGASFLLIGLHLILVVRNGIAEPPQAGRLVEPGSYRQWYRGYLAEHGVPYWPEAAFRDLAFGVAMLAEIMLLAWLLGPPELRQLPNSGQTAGYPRPDWYFLWLFAALSLLPKGTESFVIVVAPIAIGLVLIMLPFVAGRGERSPRRRPWAIVFVVVLLAAIGGLLVVGQRAPWAPDLAAEPLPAELAGATKGPAQQGALLFQRKGCMACHAIGGIGGQNGGDLSGAGRLTPEQIRAAISDGRRNMPAYQRLLSPAELDALVAFVQSR